MKSVRNVAVAFLATVVLAACTGIGLQAPQSFEQRLAYGYATATAVVETAAVSVQRGELSKPDGEAVLDAADSAKAALDVARVAYGAGDIETAEGRLSVATTLLVQLQNYLRQKGK